MTDTLPDRSLVRDARLQLEAAARRLRHVESLMGTPATWCVQCQDVQRTTPGELCDPHRRALPSVVARIQQLLGEARALLHASDARL